MRAACEAAASCCGWVCVRACECEATHRRCGMVGDGGGPSRVWWVGVRARAPIVGARAARVADPPAPPRLLAATLPGTRARLSHSPTHRAATLAHSHQRPVARVGRNPRAERRRRVHRPLRAHGRQGEHQEAGDGEARHGVCVRVETNGRMCEFFLHPLFFLSFTSCARPARPPPPSSWLPPPHSHPRSRPPPAWPLPSPPSPPRSPAPQSAASTTSPLQTRRPVPR